jgi:hypothetical protein
MLDILLYVGKKSVSRQRNGRGGPESQPYVARELCSYDNSTSESYNDSEDNNVTVEDIPSGTMPALLADFEDWFWSPDGG